MPYKDSKHKIDNQPGDNSKIVLYPDDVLEFMRILPQQLVRLVITSPPYNLGKDYEDKTTLEKYLLEQEEVIVRLRDILTENGSVCWQVGNYVKAGEVFPLDIYYYQIFKRHDFILRNRIIWHYGHGLHANNKFSGRYETILWFSKGKDYVFNLDSVRVPAKYPGKRYSKGSKKGKPSGNPKGKNPSDVWKLMAEEWDSAFWEIPNVKANHVEKTVHPCQFPVELAERCILALTNESDWVFDPYAGVGSSLIAAIKNNRRAIGCEKEAKYVEITKQRICQLFDGSLRLRPLGKSVYQPSGNEKVAKVPDEWVDTDSIYGK